MGKIREYFAKRLAPGLRSEIEVRGIVADEVKRALAALPAAVNYDPNREGYRPAGGGIFDRNLLAMDQSRMFEIAYFMFDSSPMLRRLARMDKSFLFGEPVSVTSDDDDVQEIIDSFWYDQENNLDMDLPDQIMWLSLLGEQCWPVEVNPRNGSVILNYTDPSIIQEVQVSRINPKRVLRIDLMGDGGRPGRKMAVIRRDFDPRSKTYGRLVGECFFWRINNPPNSCRGRSDYLTLFDWIDAQERHGFNSIERGELLLNFVWDITLTGMDEAKIREWLRNQAPPDPGALRAHNENVKWEAVAPDLKSPDLSKIFEMGKSFILGACGRPDSWFGAGGKAYQTEADQFGQVPIKDLDERQGLVKNIITNMIQFVIDQAVAAGRLSEAKAEIGFVVNTPEISKKDYSKIINSIPQMTTALSLAEQNNWITRDTAAGLFALAAGQMGMEIDAVTELEKIGTVPEAGTEDYGDFLKRTGGGEEYRAAASTEQDKNDQEEPENDQAVLVAEFKETVNAGIAGINKETEHTRRILGDQISGLQKETSNQIARLNDRINDRATEKPVINIATPPVNIDVHIEKGKIKKTINYTDIEGKPKEAMVTEEES